MKFFAVLSQEHWSYEGTETRLMKVFSEREKADEFIEQMYKKKELLIENGFNYMNKDLELVREWEEGVFYLDHCDFECQEFEVE